MNTKNLEKNTINTTNTIKSAFGNTLSELPKTKIAIHSVDFENKSFVYEIEKDLGIKDWNNKPKYIFKTVFTEKAKFVDEKLTYLKQLMDSKTVAEFSFNIREKNGKKYLNIIIQNKQFEQE